MELGIMLPQTTLPPALGAPPWEVEADPAALAGVARAAEAAGFRYLCAPEHIALPLAREGTRGARYYDPFTTLGYLAAVTERIRLVTYVLVLAYHHPLDVVKRLGTLDRLSGGRVDIGLGVGSLEEEFALLGAPFEGRGAQADDALRAITAAMGERVASYSGTHYDYREYLVDPGLRPGTPTWIGGRSRRSLVRAVEFADVWSPFGLSTEQAIALFDEPRVRDAVQHHGRTPALVYYASAERLDPLGDPDRSTTLLDALRKAGARGLVVHPTSTSPAHYADQLHALAELTARG